MATILLVDDVQLFLELEKSFLEDGGHRAVTAQCAKEALARLAEVQPDLLLCDLYMAGMDGDEVCRQLRLDPRWQQLPILMVTAAGKDEDVRRCLEAGCDDYITKPVNKKDLLEKVDRLLGKVKGRTLPRAEVALRVQVKAEGQSLSAYARDLSANGIYLKCPTRLAPGTVVELKLALPDGREMKVLGKVKRVQDGADGGMGIYFIHPEPLGRKTLGQLVDQELEALPVAPPHLPQVCSQQDRLVGLEKVNVDLRGERQRLRQRITELEAENQEFAARIIHAEEVNNNLTNLYVAASRLHAVLDRAQVVEIIKEVVINFVGAEKFALLLLDREGEHLLFEAGEGVEREEFPELRLGEGLLGRVAGGAECHFRDGDVTAGSEDLADPIAAIPLHIHGRPMGLLAVYRLFLQKERFEPVDYQLFSMLAEHAATALFSATLYGDSERKRATYRGLVDLLLK
jgi:uncharacterized protein (TIGR02266 family)